ncbi:hypothetical protein ACHAWF_013626, partial [Thalassiosira exigua]
LEEATIAAAHPSASIEEPQNLPSRLLPPRLFVGHDPVRRGQNDLPELTGREEVDDPLLDLVDGHVEPGGDDAALVEASVELDDNLLGAVVVDDLEFADVPCVCH